MLFFVSEVILYPHCARFTRSRFVLLPVLIASLFCNFRICYFLRSNKADAVNVCYGLGDYNVLIFFDMNHLTALENENSWEIAPV